MTKSLLPPVEYKSPRVAEESSSYWPWVPVKPTGSPV